jgi:hypothetical protein|nr:hypothetical protein [Neorhizobium tomejilense]
MVAMFMRSGKVLVADGDVPADINNPMDILGWMNEGLDLEEGITFKEIVRCLAPWSAAVSHIVHCDFDALVARCDEGVPEDHILLREDYVCVEVNPSIGIDREEHAPVANVSVEWNAFGRLRSPIVDHGQSTHVTGLSLRHPAEYAHLPVVIGQTATVSDIMTGGTAAPWNMEPALHPTSDGGVASFTATPTVIDTLLYGLLDEVRHAGSDDHVARVSASITELLDRYA